MTPPVHKDFDPTPRRNFCTRRGIALLSGKQTDPICEGFLAKVVYSTYSSTTQSTALSEWNNANMAGKYETSSAALMSAVFSVDFLRLVQSLILPGGEFELAVFPSVSAHSIGLIDSDLHNNNGRVTNRTIYVCHPPDKGRAEEPQPTVWVRSPHDRARERSRMSRSRPPPRRSRAVPGPPSTNRERCARSPAAQSTGTQTQATGRLVASGAVATLSYLLGTGYSAVVVRWLHVMPRSIVVPRSRWARSAESCGEWSTGSFVGHW